MKEKGRYRHELKYDINQFQYMQLKNRLQVIMKPDRNSQLQGFYKVQSIYFDNIYDKAVKEKVNGISKREKFRIRYYNDNFSYIVLEKKIKNNNLCKKLSTRITEEECRNILNGNISFMATHKEELVREFYRKMTYEILRPRVLVSYYREAFIFSAGNVRVTFDYQIRTSLFDNRFLESDMTAISATEASDTMILEIKYDDFLPEIIANSLQVEGIRQQAFSKYVAARRFG